MSQPRPTFTVETQAKSRARLPVAAWALSAFGAGAAAGGALGAAPPCGPPFCGSTAPPFALALSLAAAFGAAGWILMPIKGDREATVRSAALLSFVAAGVAGVIGALVIAGGALGSLVPFGAPVLAASAVGLAAPAVMLGAARPDAVLEVVRGIPNRPAGWLSVGAVPAAAWFLGSGLGILLPSAAWLLAALCLAAGGAILVWKAEVPGGDGDFEASPPEPRPAMLLRMSPMLRYDLLLEASLLFAALSAATAVAVAGPPRGDWQTLAASLALGGAGGAACYGLLSPALDGSLGRGRLIALSAAAASLAPLALASSFPRLDPLPSFAAAALLAFALSSAPQRYALTFDLATSRGRLRTAADLQGVKLAAGALAPPVFLTVEAALPGLGLVAASAISLCAFPFFAPTLGGLGRRGR